MQADDALARRHVVALLLLLGYLVQVAVRLLLVHGRTGPLALPDEGGYLLDARVIAGGLPADISGWPLYRGGYSLLIAPVYLFTRDPHTIYRAILTENAFVNAAVFPLTYALATRVFALRRSAALWLAFGAALLPAVVFYGEWALSDAVLATVTTAWLLAVSLWLQTGGPEPGTERRRWMAGITAAILAAGTDAVHARGAVIAAAFGLLLIAAYWRRWDERRRVVTIAIVLIVALIATSGFNHWTAHENWPRGTFDFGHQLRPHLTTAAGLWRTGLVSIGALWATGIATLGFGIVALLAPIIFVRRDGERLRTVMTLLIVITAVGIAIASAAGGPEEHRVGNWAYTRYLSCLDPALICAGAAALAAMTRREGLRLVAATAAVMTALALVVGIGARHQLHHYFYVQFDFPETSPLTRSWTHLHLATATVVVLALFVIASAAFLRWPRHAWVSFAVLLSTVGVYSGVADRDHISSSWEAWYFPRGQTFLTAAGVRPPARVAVQSCCWGTVLALQWEDYWSTPAFVAIDAASPPPGYDVVVVASHPPQHVAWRGWRATVRTGAWTIWVRDGTSG